MKQYVAIAARLLLGLIFFGSAVAFFVTTPPPLEGNMAKFFEGMLATGYFFYLLKATELVCGLFLLSGFFIPLALVILAPVTLNIFLVHVFMAPEGLPIAVAIGILHTYLAFFSNFSQPIKNLFRPK